MFITENDAKMRKWALKMDDESSLADTKSIERAIAITSDIIIDNLIHMNRRPYE